MNSDLEDRLTIGLRSILPETEYHKIPDFLENAYQFGEGVEAEVIMNVEYDDAPAVVFDELTGSFTGPAGIDFWNEIKNMGVKL